MTTMHTMKPNTKPTAIKILSICLMIALIYAVYIVDQTASSLDQQQQASTNTSNINDDFKHMHKLMSEMDLRRTFQVDSHDQVPEYEILKLTVHDDGSHLISPISDLGELTHQTVRHKRSPLGDRTNYSARQRDDAKQDEMIVMNLSTFGQDFKLRLKRNTDFQQRIKDMKMFIAESTQDGRLRYTEIKNNANSNHNQQQQSKSNQHRHTRQPDDNGGWNIGSTYHDEENLAALLIDKDRKTGQLQLDGTIGNDFVIKPMPQATMESLRERQLANQQQQQKQQQTDSLTPSTSNNSIGVESLANVDLERSSSHGKEQATANHSSSSNQQASTTINTASVNAGQTAPVDLEQLAAHMHDDDPHDDDEMFLDEDEALELAHLQASASIESNHTTTNNKDDNLNRTNEKIPQTSIQKNQQQNQPRQLSKAASERKWRKYRKLMAQTQVPKPGAVAHQLDQQQSDSKLSSKTTTTTRSRRHAHHQTDLSHQHNPIHVSHHIIYRQKPSSEESTDDHQHSFMLAPGQQSMEQMARRFSKRSADETSSNKIDGDTSRLSAASAALDASDEADFASDPLGGQFYLEPGLLSLDPKSADSWSLIGTGRRTLGSPPPYAMNGTSDDQWYSYLNSTAINENGSDNSTTSKTQTHGARYKRHARGGGGGMRTGGSQVRRKRQAPDTVWPEVLLVVDYDSFLLHGGDSRDVKRYFVSFWNGVDLRYKLLVHPHIRISLAGMIVAKDRDATPYLERNRLRAPNADAVDAAGALTDMGKYLYREDRLPTYDLAVVITKLDMCRRRYEGGRCNRGTAGFAYVGGACVVNKRLEKVNSVAIIEDSGGFSGIIVAAHEVGHLLGCVHDGSPPPSYLGGPGATHCPWEDGFIMSDLRHTERGFRWSQCSVEQFKHFLNGETATCLYNYPHESQMLHRLLPGTMLSLDEQCKRDRGTNACFKDARVCAQLFCFDSASGYCVSYRPAAEGSPCGEGQVCRNGKCVGEIENIIPDYTHQSQTVVARRPSLVAPVGPQVGPIGRLADNGLSASSTSTATSSPDHSTAGKLSSAPPSSPVSSSTTASSSAASPSQQISSRRMDTFPVDMPASGPPPMVANSGSFGGRTFDPTTTATIGANYNSHHQNRNLGQQALQQNAKLMHEQHHQPATARNQQNNSAYQQRSGHSAQLVNSRANPGHQNQNQRRYQRPNNSNPRSSLAPPTTTMHTSASNSLAQYQHSTNKQNSNNNLLTTSTKADIELNHNLKTNIEPAHHQPINENGANLRSYQSNNNRQQHHHQASPNNQQRYQAYDNPNRGRSVPTHPLNPFTSSGIESTFMRSTGQQQHVKHDYYSPIVV